VRKTYIIIIFIDRDSNSSLILAMPLSPTSVSVGCQTDCFATDGYKNSDYTFNFTVTRISSITAATQVSIPPRRTYTTTATETVAFNIPTFKVVSQKCCQLMSCTFLFKYYFCLFQNFGQTTVKSLSEGLDVLSFRDRPFRAFLGVERNIFNFLLDVKDAVSR
jgi:hypothetical protein